MVDMRQFGDGLLYDSPGRDLVEICDFAFDSRIEVFNPRPTIQDDLARVVEADIIPRLMLAHRQDAGPSGGNILPDTDQVEAFTDLILAPAGADFDSRLSALLASDLAPDSLLLDLLAPTARHLGTLWEDDLCDFVEVTRAMGRLQRIMRAVTHRFDRAPHAPRNGRSVLLLPCPGDTHSFGLTVVARFFHESGWAVSCRTAANEDVVSQVRDGWFDVVGLSLACEVLVPRMTEMIAGIRRHSRNPALRVIVGGPVFLADPGRVGQVRADATAHDARQAVHVAESLLDLSARPC
ncbi:hypothetical protein AOPFMNJM_0275 [Methylobacterium jeotgali]|uniref:B12-binding domain-containing protein n=5 Tax=Pseudomonadota TaxID=1224 RepID=A0ABQ4SP37_9HYPH|nr:hypothetical protein AOPFMNJM_0275 [Methylobacterium jeotgali]